MHSFAFSPFALSTWGANDKLHVMPGKSTWVHVCVCTRVMVERRSRCPTSRIISRELQYKNIVYIDDFVTLLLLFAAFWVTGKKEPACPFPPPDSHRSHDPSTQAGKPNLSRPVTSNGKESKDKKESSQTKTSSLESEGIEIKSSLVLSFVFVSLSIPTLYLSFPTRSFRLLPLKE